MLTECRIFCKKVSWPEQDRQRFGGHDGVVFRRGKVRDAEGVPQDNVFVVDALGGVRGDPGGEVGVCGVGLAARLRNVAAGRMQLVVGVCFRGESVFCTFVHGPDRTHIE